MYKEKQEKERRFIYALFDPRTREDRYVGQAKNTERRRREHLRDRRRSYTTNWIRSLVRAGVEPDVRVLAVVESRPDASRVEYLLIKAWKSAGKRLTNTADGGHGGVTCSSKQISRWMKAARATKKNWQGHAGFKHSAEAKAKMRAAKLGRTLSAAHKAQISASLQAIGYQPTSQARAAAVAARTGSRHTAATRAVISRKIAALMTPAHRAQVSAWTRAGMARM